MVGHFAEEWNGVSFFITPNNPSMLYIDTSGSWGRGAVCGNSRFMCEWPAEWSAINIAVKELLPIVLAAGSWGRCWSRSQVLCYSDNMAVVQALKSRPVRDVLLMRLLQALFFIEAYFNISFLACHIPGTSNWAADCLSRNNLQEFFSIFPQADSTPSSLLQTCSPSFSTCKRTGHPRPGPRCSALF